MRDIWIILILFLFSGCAISHNYKSTLKNRVVNKNFNEKDLFEKFKRCFSSEEYIVLLEEPLNYNYKKIRIYHQSHNFYKLGGVITIFKNENKTSLYVMEDISSKLNIYKLIEENKECPDDK